MRNLYRLSVLRSLFHKWKVFPKRSLSQNFLIDQNIIKKIIKLADIGPNDKILEIGPGIGTLTEALLNNKAQVIAIEKDKTFASKLKETLNKNNLQVFEKDFLTFPLKDILEKNMKVVSNPPYSVLTPILEKLFDHCDFFSTITLNVQYELAQRMLAKKNDKNYSSFSVFIQFYTHCKQAFKISPSSFYPKPKVQSSVIQLTFHKLYKLQDRKSFHLFVQKAFQQKRKKIINSLKKSFSKKEIEKALIMRKLPLDARAQNLDIEDYLFIFQHLALKKDEKKTPLSYEKDFY